MYVAEDPSVSNWLFVPVEADAAPIRGMATAMSDGGKRMDEKFTIES